MVVSDGLVRSCTDLLVNGALPWRIAVPGREVPDPTHGRKDGASASRQCTQEFMPQLFRTKQLRQPSETHRAATDEEGASGRAEGSAMATFLCVLLNTMVNANARRSGEYSIMWPGRALGCHCTRVGDGNFVFVFFSCFLRTWIDGIEACGCTALEQAINSSLGLAGSKYDSQITDVYIMTDGELHDIRTIDGWASKRARFPAITFHFTGMGKETQSSCRQWQTLVGAIIVSYLRNIPALSLNKIRKTYNGIMSYGCIPDLIVQVSRGPHTRLKLNVLILPKQEQQRRS